MRQMRFLVLIAVLCLIAGSAWAIAKMTTATIDQKDCTGCGSCIEQCPERAIELSEDGTAIVNKEKCIGCGKCTNACPLQAIRIQ